MNPTVHTAPQLNDLVIRPAEPQDASAMVPLVHSSGPSAFDFVFVDELEGASYGFLEECLLQKPGEHGYGHHCVASHGGTVVGAGCGFDGYEARSHTPVALRQILSHYGLRRGLGVIKRGLQIERIIQPPKRDLFYIGHLGVSRDWRGRGIGAQLIEHFLAIGRKRGRPTAALDVSVENPRAQALYERLGFVVTRTFESSYRSNYGSVASHRRMEISLK